MVAVILVMKCGKFTDIQTDHTDRKFLYFEDVTCRRASAAVIPPSLGQSHETSSVVIYQMPYMFHAIIIAMTFLSRSVKRCISIFLYLHQRQEFSCWWQSQAKVEDSFERPQQSLYILQGRYPGFFIGNVYTWLSTSPHHIWATLCRYIFILAELA